MIGDYFKENPDARVIVFVKTRELVKAIETYMKETEELRILNPIQFVGVQANKESGGKDKIESMLRKNTVKWVFFVMNRQHYFFWKKILQKNSQLLKLVCPEINTCDVGVSGIDK